MAPATSELDDDALQGLSEAELVRMMASLQSSAAAPEARDWPCSSAGTSSRVRRPQRERTPNSAPTEPHAIAPFGAAVLGAGSALCVAALVAMVLNADGHQEEFKCGALRQQLEQQLRASQLENEATQRKLQATIAQLASLQSDTSERGMGLAPSVEVQGTLGHQLHVELQGVGLASTTTPSSHMHCVPCTPCIPCAPAPECPQVPPAPSRLLPTSPQLALAPAQGATGGSAGGLSKETAEQLRAQLRRYARENEQLREEPARLQTAVHSQSELIWHLRAQAQSCAKSLQRVEAASGRCRRSCALEIRVQRRRLADRLRHDALAAASVVSDAQGLLQDASSKTNGVMTESKYHPSLPVEAG